MIRLPVTKLKVHDVYGIFSVLYKCIFFAEIYSRIPTDIDILLTHTPPYEVLDVTKRGKHAGCKYLSDKLSERDMDRCRLHVWGHIHEARGVRINQNCVQVNAAIAQRGPPIIVDLRNNNSGPSNFFLLNLIAKMSITKI
jgi:Icc-related predicted phosphoesterase